MSKMFSHHPHELRKTAAASSEQSTPNKFSRPGWLEILVALVVYAIVGFWWWWLVVELMKVKKL